MIELLIAMTVMSVALLTLVATFSSSSLAINRANRTANAKVLADVQMEVYRGKTWGTIANYSNPNSTGPDGRNYDVEATVTTQNAPGTTRPVKTVNITVTDSSGHVWASEQSVFDQLSGS